MASYPSIIYNTHHTIITLERLQNISNAVSHAVDLFSLEKKSIEKYLSGVFSRYIYAVTRCYSIKSRSILLI